MAKPFEPKDHITREELSISNMWELAAIREILERKGLLSKPEILDAIRELRRQNPTARTPQEIDDPSDQSFLESDLITEAENVLNAHIMDTMNGAKLTAAQARELFYRCLRLVELGEGIGKNTPH